jgi:hypothetical protein
MDSRILVVSYLAMAVCANGLVGYFGPVVLPLTALAMIPFELTVRDLLHERWNGSFVRLSALVVSGSAVSWMVAPISVCVASASAFFLSGLSDWLVYIFMAGHPKNRKMIASNSVSSIVDSMAFQLIAFGVISLEVLVCQSGFKIAGGVICVAVFGLILSIGRNDADLY